MNPFEMVIGIILIVTIGRVLKARYGIRRDIKGNELQRARRCGDRREPSAEGEITAARAHPGARARRDRQQQPTARPRDREAARPAADLGRMSGRL